MLRAVAGLLAFVFIVVGITVPAMGFWGLYEESALNLANHSGHWLSGRAVYVIFLLAFGVFCGLVAFALLRYMYAGRQKAKLPPSHNISFPR